MYGQQLTKDLAGHLGALRHALLVALGDTADVPPDDPFIDSALTAAFRIHQAGKSLWRFSQAAADIEPTGSEDSSGQYDPPGADPDPRDQNLGMLVAQRLAMLEERLIEALHVANAAGYREFVDTAVAAVHRVGQARRSLIDGLS